MSEKYCIACGSLLYTKICETCGKPDNTVKDYKIIIDDIIEKRKSETTEVNDHLKQNADLLKQNVDLHHHIRKIRREQSQHNRKKLKIETPEPKRRTPTYNYGGNNDKKSWAIVIIVILILAGIGLLISSYQPKNKKRTQEEQDMIELLEEEQEKLNNELNQDEIIEFIGYDPIYYEFNNISLINGRFSRVRSDEYNCSLEPIDELYIWNITININCSKPDNIYINLLTPSYYTGHPYLKMYNNFIIYDIGFGFGIETDMYMSGISHLNISVSYICLNSTG